MNTEIKKAIIENEMRLLEAFPEYASSIKQFIPKLELINRDMDLYSFIHASFKNKATQENEYNWKGFVSSRQLIEMLKNELDNNDLTCCSSLIEGQKYNYLNISALANNFNLQVGMYFCESTESVIIKSTIGESKQKYDDHWCDTAQEILYYCMQKEAEENAKTRNFKSRPNAAIYKSIINNTPIDIYVFMNSKKKGLYSYMGIYHPIMVDEGNKAFILIKKGSNAKYRQEKKDLEEEIIINVTTKRKKKEKKEDNSRSVPALPDVELKVGKFIYTALENLIKSGFLFTEEELQHLCDKKWSSKTLKTDYAFFVEYNGDDSILYDKKGRLRYRKTLKLEFSGKIYFVTKELWETKRKNNKEAFIAWYKTLK